MQDRHPKAFPSTAVSGTGTRAPRIGILCVSAIADDPRVRRQGDLFSRRGWDVVTFGLAGARSAAPSWTCLAVADREAPDPGLGNPVLRKIRRLADAILVRLEWRRADAVFWKWNPQPEAIFEAARAFRADIWLANDWTTLLVARRLAREQNVPYAYDTHELAVEEYTHLWRWRLAQRPVVAAVEREGIAGACVVSCPSAGIAERLDRLYGLAGKPLLVRNAPSYEPHRFRPCGKQIEVLYHGIVAPGRALEDCIRSVALWRPEFRLTIRGPASESYRRMLQDLARRSGVADRVVLEPPVPMTDLVREAARFDIGLFVLPGHSQQNVYVLPNKFFEYVMAGLALCVSDLPEMAALLREHALGHLVPDVAPGAIAAAVNGFDRAQIEACKQRALEAAKRLNWEAEADRFFTAIAGALPAENGR